MLRSGLLLCVILAAGVGLRCYGIAYRSLWFDEAISYWTSQLPSGELLHRLAHGVHPPLHYFLLKLWIEAFGPSLLAMRSLSVLLGGLTIVGAYFFTVEVLRGCNESGEAPGGESPRARETGLWVAALVAVSVLQIKSAWDVRMYALGAALAVFSSWALFRALHSPRRLLPWAGYALLAVLFAYTHNFALLTIAAQGVFVAGYFLVQARGSIRGVLRQRQFLCAVLAGVVIVLAWAPWLAVFLRQRQQIASDHWVPPVSWISACVSGFHTMIGPEMYPTIPEGVAGGFCAFACVAAPLVLLRKARAAEWYIAAAALLPIALSLFASAVLGTQVFYSRYLLFAHLFILASFGMLLSRIGSSWRRRTAAGLLLLLMLAVDLRYMDKLDLANNNAAVRVVAYIESRRQPDDPVVAATQLFYLPLRYHAAGAPGWYQFGQSTRPDGLDAWTAMGADNVIDAARLNAITHGRVWVVETQEDSPWRVPVPVPARWIERSRISFADTYGFKTDMVVVEYQTDWNSVPNSAKSSN